MDNETDLQAERVLAGLDGLATLLMSGSVAQSLDLDNNAKTSDQYDLLLRLRRSLSQYVDRQKTLFYVGLMGHFSTGKSSTINSLLALDGTVEARKTSQNPTDKVITLITHSKNSSSILGVAREGTVAIRYHGIDHPLLDNIVLVDTPGQGDPGLVTEMVRDFLPLCDLILFTFSAASPFDEADVEILRELHDHLSFVPIHFVVTRANEFAADHRKSVSAKNIDSAKLREFFDTLIPRVNTLTQPRIYTEKDFTIVDNLSKFNIDILSKYIEDKCDPTKVDARIAMRDHKIFYFRKTAEDIRNYFLDFISERISALKNVVEQTSKNIDRYNEAVSISSIQLTRKWHEQYSKIDSAQSDARSFLNTAINVASNWQSLDLVQEARGEIASAVSEEARKAAYGVGGRAKDRAVHELREGFRSFSEQFPAADYLDRTLTALSPIAINLRPERHGGQLVDQRTLVSWWERVRKAESEAISDLSTNLRRRLTLLENFVRDKSSFTSSDSSVTEMQNSLLEDMSRFFFQVELYLDGVVNLATKQNVATLGIGGQLDELLIALQEADKDAYTREAIEAVFPDFANIQLRVAAALADIGSRIRDLVEEARNLRPISQPDVTGFRANMEANGPDGVELRSALDHSLQIEIDRIANEATTKLSEELTVIRADYERAVAAALRERRTRYILVIAVAGLVGTLALVGLKFFAFKLEGTLLDAVLWGVVGNILGDAIGLVIGKLFDNFPQSKRSISEKYQANMKAVVATILGETMSANDLREVDSTTKTASSVANSIHKIIDLDGIGRSEELGEQFAQIYGIFDRLRELSAELVVVVDRNLGELSGYFSNPESTLEGLRIVGAKIKEQAIEPSSDLLSTTQSRLDEVREKMAKILFV